MILPTFLPPTLLSLLLLRITEMETGRVGGSVAVYLLEDWWRRKCNEIVGASGGRVTRMRHRFDWHWCGHLAESSDAPANTLKPKVVNRHQVTHYPPLPSPKWTNPQPAINGSVQVLINDNILVPQTDVVDKQKCANIFASGDSTD